MKPFWIAVVAGVFFLLVAVFIFGYLKPIFRNQKPPQDFIVEAGDDIPAGYFDLREQQEVLVDIKNFNFTPGRIVVSRGTKVIWRNDDKDLHSVIFDGQGIQVNDSGLLKQGQLFDQVLALPGEYPYHSSDNPEAMKGVVIVSSEGGSASGGK